MRSVKLLMLVCSTFIGTTSYCIENSLSAFADAFVKGYTQLNIPGLEYDYQDYFNAIPSLENVKAQQDFFEQQLSGLKAYSKAGLSTKEKVLYDHLQYEIQLNLERTNLEIRWIAAGRKMPQGGLYSIADHKDWYAWFVKRYTTCNIAPAAVYTMGENEVSRVKGEIEKLQLSLGFDDSATFYKHLGSDRFMITSKQDLLKSFEEIDSAVRKYLPEFIGTTDIPAVYPMEWPGATANTPPGIYLNRSYNAYGKDVFQFNFYNNRYNVRSMEWLYMHEAIPGHHLQFSLQSDSNVLSDLFLYPGNFEGWGCYVEYFGKELGLYQDPYSYLGKWEWDLVRSARLVIDAGIHYYGWTREQALNYWKMTIPGQDDIAEREVTRVTNWPCQALSYKVGAAQIFSMQEAWQQKHPGEPLKKFRLLFLNYGRLPLHVIKKILQYENYRYQFAVLVANYCRLQCVRTTGKDHHPPK